ncbi:hypothetical protein KSD_79450 [Ktedonobacter sp. SOSP1-85]|uniref:transposase n=1 Tax=Ktedonobacter sp. SOSP1-85 TaxID=2778367 RepID=UPI00191563F2|nr:transposase [Ktedonobacter sp. SOSP1-85]GHO80174.1 hypothetical protein KSD_79450 [Ktedonobacter sp. SOSP1-85]
MRHLHKQKVRFYQHPKANTVFWDREGKRIELERILPRTIGQVKVKHVYLGAQDPLPVRLLMVRVPDEVVAQRRERLAQEAADKGQAVNSKQWDLAAWTLIVTNAAAKHVGPAHALVIMRERWVIELLFKLWKSQGHIEEWRSEHPWRALCELYAKLMAVMVQHWLLLCGMQAGSLAPFGQSLSGSAFSCLTRVGSAPWLTPLAPVGQPTLLDDAVRLSGQSSRD